MAKYGIAQCEIATAESRYSDVVTKYEEAKDELCTKIEQLLRC